MCYSLYVCTTNISRWSFWYFTSPLSLSGYYQAVFLLKCICHILKERLRHRTKVTLLFLYVNAFLYFPLLNLLQLFKFEICRSKFMILFQSMSDQIHKNKPLLVDNTSGSIKWNHPDWEKAHTFTKYFEERLWLLCSDKHSNILLICIFYEDISYYWWVELKISEYSSTRKWIFRLRDR